MSETYRTCRYGKYSLDEIFLAIIVVAIAFANSNILACRMTMYATFLTTILLLPIMRGKWVIAHRGITRSALVLMGYNIFISVFLYFDYTSVYNGLLYCALVMFFAVLISGKYTVEKVYRFAKLMTFISKALFVFGLALFFIPIPFVWVSGTSFLFLFLYFIYLDAETSSFCKVTFTLIWLFIAYIDSQRTWLLLYPILLMLLATWDTVSRTRKRYMLLFVTVSIVVMVIPVAYVWLSLSPYADTLNAIAVNYTKGRFFSGRDVIWLNLFQYYLETNILLGGGHHVSPEFVYGSRLSAHNTYVAILTRTGLVGYMLFVYFAGSIWRRYFDFRTVQAVKLTAVFFIVSLLKQSSELSLIGNNVALSMMSWVIVAFGLIFATLEDNKSAHYVSIRVGPRNGDTDGGWIKPR